MMGVFLSLAFFLLSVSQISIMDYTCEPIAPKWMMMMIMAACHICLAALYLQEISTIPPGYLHFLFFLFHSGMTLTFVLHLVSCAHAYENQASQVCMSIYADVRYIFKSHMFANRRVGSKPWWLEMTKVTLGYQHSWLIYMVMVNKARISRKNINSSIKIFSKLCCLLFFMSLAYLLQSC